MNLDPLVTESKNIERKTFVMLVEDRADFYKSLGLEWRIIFQGPTINQNQLGQTGYKVTAER